MSSLWNSLPDNTYALGCFIKVLLLSSFDSHMILILELIFHKWLKYVSQFIDCVCPQIILLAGIGNKTGTYVDDCPQQTLQI